MGAVAIAAPATNSPHGARCAYQPRIRLPERLRGAVGHSRALFPPKTGIWRAPGRDGRWTSVESPFRPDHDIGSAVTGDPGAGWNRLRARCGPTIRQEDQKHDEIRNC